MPHFEWSTFPTVLALIRGGWRSKHSRLLLLATAAVILVIWRPAWLADLFAVTPAFRSTRWPFREVVVLLFFVHLLFLFNYRPIARPWNWGLWGVALIPLLVLVSSSPPTMGYVELSRRLIISGAADAYWKTIRPTLGPHANVACADLSTMEYPHERAPFPLLPSHNFPALFGTVSVSGYSTGSPLLLDRSRLLPPTVDGIYSPEQARVYLEHFPDSRLTILHSLNPPVWTILESGRERRLTLDPSTLAITEVPIP